MDQLPGVLENVFKYLSPFYDHPIYPEMSQKSQTRLANNHIKEKEAAGTIKSPLFGSFGAHANM
jgi:hypothetical protein